MTPDSDSNTKKPGLRLQAQSQTLTPELILLLLQCMLLTPTMQYDIYQLPTTQYDSLNLTVMLIGAMQPHTTNQHVRLNW